MSDFFTPKQAELMRSFKRRQLKRINILEGSVRSGKTWVSLVLWAVWVATMPKGCTFLMTAKTLTSLSRNCLGLLQELVGKNNFTYSLSQKTGTLFGRTIYLEGVNDTRAEAKIRGMTLSGAYCDELTLFTEDFFSMLLSRLSMPGAKLIGTTNPDRPTHWLRKSYLDRKDKLDLYVERFLIDDNTFLDGEYVRQLKLEYTGVFYDRFILGLWVNAQGLIFPMYKESIVKTENRSYERYILAVDYGTHNATAMGLWGLLNGVWYCAKEYYYSGRESQQPKTDDEYYSDMVAFVGGLPVKTVIIDPSAASFITLIKKKGKFSVRPAENAVVTGILQTASAMKSGIIKINDCCKNGIKEIESYSWDEKSNEDKPIKANDHFCDMMRYFVYTEVYNKKEVRWI